MTSARRVGFFGPFGTFTQQALLTQADLADLEQVPYRTAPDVLDAVAVGDVEVGLVPIENSIEGMVNFTQDALAFDYDLLITREIVIDIDGDEIVLGEVRLRFLETPGHTPESVSVLVLEDGAPRKVLTGDTLFIGDVGRPDLVVCLDSGCGNWNGNSTSTSGAS